MKCFKECLIDFFVGCCRYGWQCW